MVDHQKVKLGKRPAKLDARTLRLAKYFLASLPPAPAEVDWTSGITDWGMMLNDTLRDCTIAGCGHAMRVWSAARGGEYTLPDAAILQKYEQWCGYVDGDSSTDQGGVEIDVLNDWRNRAFYGHLLYAYADPDPMDLEYVKQAINLFGGIYIGLALPMSAQGNRTWDVSSGDNAIPGSWGGHAVFCPKYRTDTDGNLIITAISWGELYDITQAFWLYNDPANGPYIDEVHALIAPEFLSLKTDNTPEGLDLDTLKEDLAIITS